MTTLHSSGTFAEISIDSNELGSFLVKDPYTGCKIKMVVKTQDLKYGPAKRTSLLHIIHTY